MAAAALAGLDTDPHQFRLKTQQNTILCQIFVAEHPSEQPISYTQTLPVDSLNPCRGPCGYRLLMSCWMSIHAIEIAWLAPLRVWRRASVFGYIWPKDRCRRPVDQKAFVIDLPREIFLCYTLCNQPVCAQFVHTICTNLEELAVHIRDLSAAGVVGKTSRNYQSVLSI